MAEAAKNAEAAEKLRGEIAELRAWATASTSRCKSRTATPRRHELFSATRAIMELCQCRDAVTAVNQTPGRKLLTCNDSLNHT